VNPARAQGARLSPEALAARVSAGDRRALAQAITLIESTRPDDRERAASLLEAVHPAAGGSLRVGVSGPPGAGKSTLIEALGLHAVERGHRVAVLAVDPSSVLSGGSVLGDKTRMELLARTEAAFIRPSPAAGARGGVHARTPESIEVCEAAGFDLVLVETVGAGQADTEVAGMADVFVLLELPFAGDGLQALKRGSNELADVIVFTKADLDAAAAEVACARMNEALALLRPARAGWRPRALVVSAFSGEGIAELWEELGRFRTAAAEQIAATRERQVLARLSALIDAGLRSSVLSHIGLCERLAELEAAVTRGDTPALTAAEAFLRAAADQSAAGGNAPAAGG
jgi:LAO/AO transport system kinase